MQSNQNQESTSTQYVTSETVKFLFGKFLARYGHKWTSQYDVEILPIVHAEWLTELKGFTAEDIRRGLDAWRGHWPPNQYEFADACRPVETAPALPYHKTYSGKALPAPKNKKLANKAMKEIRKSLGVKK